MSRGINKVILIGNLGKDPELRYTQSGTPVASFSLATNESWTDNEGNKHDETEWHQIVAWRGLAEICGQYLTKGKQIYVEGKLQTRSWEDQSGAKRYTTEVVMREMKMLGSAGDRQDARPPMPEEPPPSMPESQGGTTEDDIPF